MKKSGADSNVVSALLLTRLAHLLASCKTLKTTVKFRTLDQTQYIDFANTYNGKQQSVVFSCYSARGTAVRGPTIFCLHWNPAIPVVHPRRKKHEFKERGAATGRSEGRIEEKTHQSYRKKERKSSIHPFNTL